MMLGCDSYFKYMISRYVRWQSVTFLNASKMRFSAHTYLFLLLVHFHTCPYAPFPTFFIISYFFIIFMSMLSFILQIQPLPLLYCYNYCIFTFIITHNNHSRDSHNFTRNFLPINRIYLILISTNCIVVLMIFISQEAISK